jgi:hypothetical protein
MATYYVGTPSSGNGNGSSANPWNQAGFNAATLTFGDSLIVNSGSSLTTTVNQLFASLPTSTSSTRGAQLGSENQVISAAPGTLIAYGANSSWSYRVVGVSGQIALSNATFDDPIPGTPKKGYAVTSLTISASGFSGTYDIADIAAALAVDGGALFNGATDLTATTAATVAQATTIEGFSNSGTNTYNISDTSANLAASTNAVLSLAGTVTASDTASASQANTLGGFSKAVVYSISDTAANVAGATATALNEAVNITATGTANSAETSTILAAANTGSTTIAAASMTAAQAVALSFDATGNDTISSLSITDAATVAQATTLRTDQTNGDITSLSIASLTDTAANVSAISAAVLGNVTGLVTATAYTNETLTNISTQSLTVITASGATLDASKLATAHAITIGAGTASGTATDVNTIGEEKITIATGTTLQVTGYTNQELAGFTKQGTGVLAVTTATGATLDSTNLADATTIVIGAGSASINAATTDEVVLANKTTVNNGSTLTVNNYVNTDLSGLSNQGMGLIVVNTTTGAELDEIKLADATSVVLGAAASGAASAIDGIGLNGSRIDLNNQTLSVSGYLNENLSGITSGGTLNVTTANGAVLDASKLATADSVTLVGTNTATAADADSLGSRLTGTATLNISTEPITANTDLSDLGSGLSLQFGGDTSLVVNGATLSVRQDQVSGYTISGTGTLSAIGTASADRFDASGISATTNFSSLAGNDTITLAPATLGSGDSIDGGDNTDTLTFSAATTTISDVAFTNVANIESLQLADGTNSLSLAAEAEQAGIITVIGGTGAETLNLLYGSTGLTFNAGGGSDTLSYSADSTSQSVTLSAISSGSASGTVSNNGTDVFTALEAIVGGSGSSDLITSTSVAESLVVTGANAGTINSFGFSGIESVDLGAGNDSGSINAAGALSGNLSFGTGTDTLSYAAYGSAVSVQLSGITSGTGTISAGGATAVSGVVNGVESLVGSAASDTLTDATGASTVVINAANGGTIDGLGFSSFENFSLSTGSDDVTVQSGGSLSGNLNLGDGTTNTLVMDSGAGAVGSVTATSGADSVTINGGSVTGAVDLGDGSNSLTISNSSSTIGGNVSFGTGTSDTLSYAGYGNAVTVSLNSATSTAAAGATGITGSVSGFEILVGGSASDTLNATSGVNSLNVAADGTTTLDTSLTVSGFETINLGASADASSDTATISGAFSGSVDLGAGSDTATVNNGGSVTNLAGGVGTDTLNLDGVANTVTITGSGAGSTTGTSGGSTTFSGFETINTLAGNDTITLANAAVSTQSVDGGTNIDTLQVAASDTSNNTLTINTASGGSLGAVSFSDIENITLGSGSDTVTIASGGLLPFSQDGLLADFYQETGTGGIGSLLASGIALGPVNLSDATLSSLTGYGDNVYVYAQGYLKVPGSGSFNDFIVSTTSDDGVRVRLDLQGNGSYSTVINNWTIHAPATDNSAALSVTAGQQIPIQIDYFENGGGAVLQLYYQANSQGISRTLVPLSNLSSNAFTPGTGVLDLGAGNDAVTIQDGALGVGSLSGGSGSDTLDYSSYGSGVTVNLATGTATATGGISGVENVLGSGSADVITATTSGDVSLQGNAGNDLFSFTVAGLTSTDNVAGGAGSDTLAISNAGTLADAQFTNVTSVESLTLTGASTLTAGTEASQAGIATVITGSGNTTVNTSLNGYDLSIDAASLGDGASLTLTGSASSNDFTVDNLVGSVLASGTSGSLTVTSGNAPDNAIGITTGSGNATINASGSGDSVSLNADAMLDNTSLDINGSATYDVTNLEANLDAAGSSGALTLTFANVTDNNASLISGSGDLVVSGGDSGDTITVTGLSTNAQTFNALASTSNFNITAGANSQTLTGSNTGSDTIDGGSGSDTLSYAGGSNVDVTITAYSTYSGGSTGQGTDTFTGTESLVGATGTDILRGTASGIDEVVTITGANSGTLRDAASTGTFSFSSFEQLDLQGGNDTLSVTGSSGGVSLAGSVDLGSGTNALSMGGSAGSIASLSAGSGTDTFTISAGSITGALNAGDGTNTLTISGTSSSVGSYGGGTGSDSLTLSGGDVTGNVDLGSGTNTLLINDTGSTIGGNVSFGSGTADTLSYAGYGTTVWVNLSAIAANSGTTTSGGATAISGVASGFETLVGGSSSGDTLTDSSGDSTIAITGANSGTIDGLAFSSFENLSLSTGIDAVTVSGSGSGVSLTGSLDLGDGTNTLTMNGSAGSIASVSSGSGDDTMVISAGSVIGAVNAGDGTNSLTISGTSSSIGSFSSGTGSDSLTLSGGDVEGNVSTGTGSDTVLISSTASTIGGNLDLGSGDSDTLSYAGYSNAVSVTLTAISSGSGSTAAGGATAISGTASGFENLVGGSNSGDTLTDSTGDSTIVISGANSGTIDGLVFSAIENLNLSTGIDGVTVTSGGSLSGNLDLGDGSSNSVVMNSGAGAIGSLTAGSGNDAITIDGGSVTGAVSSGDGTNTLIINNTNSSIGSYTGGSGVDTIVSNGGDINGNVSTGGAADALTLSDAGQISGNVSLGTNSDSSDGGDTLSVSGTSSSARAIITGSISTGAGADAVSFSDATIGGSGQTLSLGSDNNFLDGNDSLSASNSAITATVTTGSGSDSVSLTNGSSITGDVSLGINGETQTYTNTFDTASGWTGGVIDSSSSYYGSFLGRYAAGAKTLGQDTSTTLSLGSLPATISFDVHRLDSWDGELFTAYINNVAAFQRSFRAGQAISSASGSTNGYAWTITPKDSIAGHGFSGWDDQTATVTITIAAGSPTIKLGFGSGLDQGISDESYGIDNLSFSAIASSDDSLSLDASSITGNLTTGSGADIASLTSASTITGNLTLGLDGDALDAGDSLTVSGSSSTSKSVITGSVATGAGADLLSFSDATIGGSGQTLSLGSDSNGLDGGDILTATGTTITATVTTGAGSDSVSLTSSSVTGAVSLGVDGDTTNGNGDALTLNASSITGDVSTGSGADVITLSNSATISGDLTLGSNSDSSDGVDTLTVSGASSSSKSLITGSITTGAGADVVTFTNATIGGSGQTLSLGTDNNSLDGNDSLTATGTTITATVTTGAGSDTVSLTSSSVSGNVSLGSDADTADGDDTLHLGSGAVSISGDVSLGYGTGDLITYQDNPGPLTFTVSSISADSTGTGSSTAHRAALISGAVSGYEAVIGSDAVGSGLSSGDVLIDASGVSLAILSSNGAGTLDNLDFAAFESLRLGTGDDTLRFEGSAIVPGLLTGRADGGGVEGATYSYGTLSGGTYADTGTDLLDYRDYLAGSVTVDLSQNKATGVYAGQAGGLIDANGSAGVTTTSDSSFENVYGSSANDAISGDNQANLIRGHDGGDTILGLAGDDTIDGGDNTSGVDGADVIAAGDGADLILASDGSDFISGGAYTGNPGSYVAVADSSIDTLSYLDENEGLDVSLNGTDAGTVKADAASSLSVSSFTSTYNVTGAQTISVPTNQSGSSEWTDSFGDIQRLVLTSQDDILRIDSTDFISRSSPAGPLTGVFSVDAGGGSLDTIDYSSFASDKPVYVNLSAASYSFDFDANAQIDTTAGEITLANPYSATNINSAQDLAGSDSSGATSGSGVGSGAIYSPAAFGGSNGINGFEVVVGGASDDAIVGSETANILVGNDGADRIAGLGGADTIFGGKGDDYIVPGEGSDFVDAGQGINTILVTSGDLAQDTFAVDPNGINIFKLNGDGSTTASEISAPSGSWNPGLQGIDLIDGGDPVVDGSGNAIYDSIYGTIGGDNYQFGSTALKNVQTIDLKDGDDQIGTAPTSKGIKVSYDGNSGTDSVTLTLTFEQFARLNQSGYYVADVQNYIDAPSGKTFSSNQADFTATNFESAGVQVVSPAVYNALQGDPAAITFNTSIGLQDVTASSGAALALSATANTSSAATARSTEDLVSAFVQANTVKGADAATLSSGTDLNGAASADHTASASAITVNDRSDAVLSAYGLGLDRSAMTAGGEINLSLNGAVKADTTAQAGTMVVNAKGTAEAAGSRDSSLTAADALNATISGAINQTVTAAVIDGLALAGLASRTYGIDDANLTDATADSVQAGGNLGLTASASDNSQVAASGVSSLDLGLITLVDNAVATNRFTLPSSLWGAAFPLINGDRIRFSSAPAGGSLQANRDYFVLNVIQVTGEFQLSSTPAGDPIDVVTADNGTALEAFRPAVSTADAISIVTAVDLNRSGGGLVGLQAGEALNVRATASDSLRSTASSVDGDATAGLNRLGGLDNLNTQPVSSVVSLSNTASVSGRDAGIQAIAGEASTLQASTTSGDALAEGNVQVLGSDASSSTAAASLSLQASASLRNEAQATSTGGRAEARSGAGAGAGSSTGNGTGAIGNALPDAGTYALASALSDGSQTAGTVLTVAANGSLSLNATASTAGGSRSLASLWSNSSNVLSTFDPAASTPSLIGPQFLADGQRVQLDAPNATALGLTAGSDYVVRLLASTAVNAGTDRITMPTGVTYANGNAIRFRLNSTTPADSVASRYGLELGTTYYVINVSGTSFQLATAPGGAVIDLLPDSVGLADQLVDADRFQLLVPPSTSTGAYSVATLAANKSGVTLELPAEAASFAGSRQAGLTLADPTSLNLAQVHGIDGSGLAGGSGLLGLTAGSGASLNASADGVLNAMARNTAGDATASAGLVADGISNAAISAGADGTVLARATINAVADAASTGDSASNDNSLSSLSLVARGIEATGANQDVSLGGNGSITATAAIDGRSTAAITSGSADALAALQATAVQASTAGFSATIGAVGDLAASVRLGSSASPLLISAISNGAGDAAAQAASSVEGILGTSAAGSFSQVQAGAAQGDISSFASTNLQLSALATDGVASASLANVAGTGPAVVSGIRDMALNAGADLSRIDTSAIGSYQVDARSVGDDALASAISNARGILSDEVAALPIGFAQNAAIAALVNNTTLSRAISVAGDASSGINSAALGLSNASVSIGGNGDLVIQTLSRATNQAHSVVGNVSA